MREDCPDCRAPLVGGRAGCDALFLGLGARAYGNPAIAAHHRIIVDAYALQHPAYIASAKSLAAHLGGLCVGLEFHGRPILYAGLRTWLDGPVPLAKLAVPAARGTLTVLEVHDAPTPAALRGAVDRWSRDVWAAWAQHHGLARGWIQAVQARR